jgi:hypothetical protein
MGKNKRLFSSFGEDGPRPATRANRHTTLTRSDVHPRYLSEWENDVVHVDLRHHQSVQPFVRPINLGNIPLAVHGGESVYTGIQPLSKFPHLIECLKHAINRALHIYHEGNIKDDVGNLITTAQRTFIWMMRRRIYHLSALTRQELETLSEHIGKQGWWTILDYDAALNVLMRSAATDRKVLNTVIGRSKETKRFTLSVTAICSCIGMPLSANDVPHEFARDIESLARTGKVQHRRERLGLSPSPGNLKASLTAINLLAEIPENVDRISFVPYANVNKIVTKYFPVSSQTTENLELEDAIKIFKEACRWVYDLRPGVVEICRVGRGKLEGVVADGANNHNRVPNAVAEAYSRLKQQYNFHIELNRKGRHREAPIHIQLVNTAQTAALILILFNNARRCNEAVGEGVPYGLYFGCVQPIDPGTEEKRIDVYVEKSLQDYGQFWCNKLVEDSVAFLEELSQQFRPLHSEEKVYQENLQVARTDKLFCSRRFSRRGFNNPPDTYRFKKHSKTFFSLAGVNPLKLKGTKQFRRLYATLFVHRYDHPELLALSGQLGHFSIGNTERYAYDSPSRAQASRIEILYQKSLENVRLEIEMVRKEYFCEKIVQMLNGEKIGGYFPRLVLAFLKRLSKNTEFRVLSNRDKAKHVQERFERHGYKVSEKKNVVCMLGNASHTRRSAKCYKDGLVHPENANAKLCSGCVNGLNTPNTLTIYETECNELRDKANDASLPPALRHASGRQADELERLLHIERSIGQENRAIFQRLALAWKVPVTGEAVE